MNDCMEERRKEEERGGRREGERKRKRRNKERKEGRRNVHRLSPATAAGGDLVGNAGDMHPSH